MTPIARRSPDSLGEIVDWFDTTLPLRADLAPAVRVEDYTADGGYGQELLSNSSSSGPDDTKDAGDARPTW